MSVIVNPPNPANTVVVTPPSGGNLVTVLAGIAGPTGPTGATGPANSLDVISTTTGTPGSSANVVVSGTAPTQHLAFTIPSGLKGDTGATGSTGATGASNTLSVGGTTTGAAGTNAIASLSGTSPSQTLYFTIPAGVKGDTGNTGATGTKGDTGNTGATGATPTLSVNSTVATLGYGNNGVASIGGTLPNNPKLYLTLPAGPQGSAASVTEANIVSALGYHPAVGANNGTGAFYGATALISADGDSSYLAFHGQNISGVDFYGSGGTFFTLPSSDGTLITDAPSDGNQYARKDAGWVTVSGGGNPFDQSLNTTNSVTFQQVEVADIHGGALSLNKDNSEVIGYRPDINTDTYAWSISGDGSALFANGATSIDGLGSVNITTSASNDSVLKVGALEFQPYGVNNVWFGDNAYYNGNFYFRNNGSAGLFYFQGGNAGGAGEEGQFRMTANGNAGDSFSPTTQLKIAYTGEFGVGSLINTGTGAFDGSNFYVDSVGNATLAGSITTAPQSAPSSPVAGQIYFDSGDSHFYGYNGTSWVQLDN